MRTAKLREKIKRSSKPRVILKYFPLQINLFNKISHHTPLPSNPVHTNHYTKHVLTSTCSEPA